MEVPSGRCLRPRRGTRRSSSRQMRCAWARDSPQLCSSSQAGARRYPQRALLGRLPAAATRCPTVARHARLTTLGRAMLAGDLARSLLRDTETIVEHQRPRRWRHGTHRVSPRDSHNREVLPTPCPPPSASAAYSRARAAPRRFTSSAFIPRIRTRAMIGRLRDPSHQYLVGITHNRDDLLRCMRSPLLAGHHSQFGGADGTLR